MRQAMTWVVMMLFAQISIASLPETKIYNNQKDLIDGHLQGISITWAGELTLAPIVTQFFDSERLFIWDFVVDKQGTMFVATGDGVKIFHLDASGKSSVLSQWENIEVYSLSLDNRGILYAATSPDGKIYRFNNNKNPEIFAKLNVKYIWDMVFDEQNRCYVATGDSGAIYVIDPGGNVSIFYQSDETHIRCLAWDKNKQLLVGSYPNGYLYRIDSSGKAFIIYDSDFQEVHQICVANDGTIYAAALSPEEAKESKELSDDSSSRSSDKVAVFISGTSKPIGKPKSLKSGVIKIQPDGVIKNIWEETTDQVQAIQLTEVQSLLIGTSEKGRLYQISPQEEITYLLDVTASQITGFVPGREGSIWLATSNLGKIFHLAPKLTAKKGAYESVVIDAKTLSHWGTLQWDEELPTGGDIKFYTRSGNTEKPNNTWSPWTVLEKGQSIPSPDARFLQWKLEVTTDQPTRSPKIKNIRTSYLQQNLPPAILTVTVESIEKTTQFQSPALEELPPVTISVEDELTTVLPKQVTPPVQRQPLRNGYRRAVWKARDENDDQLTFALYFQVKGDENWWLLKKDLTKSNYTWDTRMMPDGNYRLKIVADDAKSNPINTAKQSEKVSDWFIVDNTAPKIEHTAIKKTDRDSLQISFQVVDELSPIKQVLFSYDIQKWSWLYPKDLICDSKREDFQFKIQLNPASFHSIVIKATDDVENIGYSRFILKE